METKETEKIKEALFSLPNMVAKFEAYFSKDEKKEEVVTEKEEVKEEVKSEDFSSLITVIEKTFTKSSDFDTLKTSFATEVEKMNGIITGLTKTNTELTEKFTKQEDLIKSIFELVTKIGETPAEASTFKKKDGAKTTPAGSMAKWMEEAKIISKELYK